MTQQSDGQEIPWWEREDENESSKAGWGVDDIYKEIHGATQKIVDFSRNAVLDTAGRNAGCSIFTCLY